jgi:hypothetical protein
MTNWQELLFRTQIEGLISEREMMKVANKERERKGESPAYREDAFDRLIQFFSNIEESIRNAG